MERKGKGLANCARRMALLLPFAFLNTAAAQTSFTVPGWLGDLTTDGTYLYMSTMSGFRPFFKIDPAAGTVVEAISQKPTAANNPRGIALDAAGRLFMTDMAPKVYEFDTSGNALGSFSVPDPIPNVTPGFRTGALAFDGASFYIGDVDATTILVTDRAGNVSRQFTVAARPEGMAFDRSSNSIWMVDLFTQNKLLEVSINGDIIRRCDVPYVPGIFGAGGVAVLGSKFYVGHPVNPQTPDGGTVIHALDRATMVCEPAFVTVVAIDIKPGGFPNSLNLGSSGVVPVAILSSEQFDATQVDPSTVTLAGAAVKLIGKGDRYSCSTVDVNADGRADLLCHVMTAQFMIEEGESVAVLEARTFSGQAIRGQDSIKVVP
jgi:hypothetical protein